MPALIPGAVWESGLLVPVPAAEPAVGQHRARLDEAARDGVPAHITVLYPFLPPAGIDKTLLAALGRLFARHAAFQFTLDKVGWFGEEVLWLGPRELMAGPRPGNPGTPPGQWRTIAAFALG